MSEREAWMKEVLAALVAYRKSYEDPSDLHARIALRRRLFQLIDDGPQVLPTGNPAGREEER